MSSTCTDICLYNPHCTMDLVASLSLKDCVLYVTAAEYTKLGAV